MAFDLFTLLCDYKGGTYISQVRASDPDAAGIEWGAQLRIEQPVERASDEIAKAAIEGLDRPVPLSGLADVWCRSATVSDELALVHLIRSRQLPAPRDPTAG